ncbi:MAG: protein kinase domain-containing protein [Gammaproteobacteria bacterium]
MSLEPGFQLGHYRIVRALGSGGMADVYEAHDDNLDRTVALKILPVEYCRNPQLVARFQKEVRAAAKLNHRNIVTVFEVGQQDNHHFFSMRLLTGGDLRARIQHGLTPVEALAILRELADAFGHAHARGFVHRDVKPENVMFDEQGFPVLTDFGIAKALNAETRMTRTGMTMGTPRYLAPEQASGKAVDARADLYSLGVILHEMLTGRPPYDAEESMAVIFKHVTEPIPVMPTAFTTYQPLLEKLMAKSPADRFGSAAELLQAIDALTPRSGTGEVKQSQLRTAANPLLAGLLTPSPLRTPAPKTPRPVTLPPVAPMRADTGSGEVAVARAVATGRRTAMPAQPSVAQPAAAASEPVAAASGRTGIVAGVVALAIGAVGAAGWIFMKPRLMPEAAVAPATSPPPTAAPAAAPQADAAARKQVEEAAARKLAEEQAAARKQAAEQAAARKLADEQAAARKQAAEQAAARKLADEQAAARKLAAEQAAARKQAEEAAARKLAGEQEAARLRAAQEAAAREEARRRTAAEAAEKQRQEEVAAAAAAAARAAPTFRFTVVNDCRQAVELVAAGADGKPVPSGTMDARTERTLTSTASTTWRIYERSPSRKLLKELTLTGAEKRLSVCGDAKPDDDQEEKVKERSRRPTGF